MPQLENNELTNKQTDSDTQNRSNSNIQAGVKPIDINTFLNIGIVIWLLATVVLRFFGSNIFRPNESLLALAIYLLSGITIILLALQIFKWQKLHPSQQFQAAILLALPGMVLDSIVMVSFRTVFPNLAPSSDSAVASWLLWSYAFVLLSAFLKRNAD